MSLNRMKLKISWWKIIHQQRTVRQKKDEWNIKMQLQLVTDVALSTEHERFQLAMQGLCFIAIALFN